MTNIVNKRLPERITRVKVLKMLEKKGVFKRLKTGNVVTTSESFKKISSIKKNGYSLIFLGL